MYRNPVTAKHYIYEDCYHFQPSPIHRWVSALEDLPSHLGPGLAHLGPDTLDTIIHWTLEAVDYQVAMKQTIAVNIRQLKAGMKLTCNLCELGPTVSKVFVVRE